MPRRTSPTCSTAAGGSWASAIASTAPRIHARGSSSGRRRSSAPRASRSAEALEKAALAELTRRHPERVLATNVEYYSAVLLDIAEIPPALAPGDVRVLPGCGLVGAHPRAEADRPSLPAVGEIRRPRRPLARHRGLTVDLAEAAELADQYAQERPRAGAGDSALAVGRRDRGRRAQRRLPHAGTRIPGCRPVPVPAEARAAPARLRGREPCRARLGADRARGAFAHAPR